MNAGASHSDPGEPPAHTYCWGSLEWDEPNTSWKLGWSPREFVAVRNEMRANRNTYDLDAAGFCWQHVRAPEPVRTSELRGSPYETAVLNQWEIAATRR
jgi:hypothetical protein